MEELNDYSTHIKTDAPIIKSGEIIELIDMICKMAKETENKSLSIQKVTAAVVNFISKNIYGHYFLIVNNLKKTFCGMNMITYEYNINSNKTIVWLQSVYIEKEYRMKKLFKNLLEENQNYVRNNINYEKKLKLYMEKNNSTAEQVYLKLGFEITEECLYEIDYDFDDLSALTSEENNKNLFESNDKIISIQPLTNENSKLLWNNLQSEFFSIISNRKLDLNEHVASYKNVINDKDKGRVIIIKDELNEKIICLFYIFFEYSDWRNSIFWWVYDFVINQEYLDFCKDNMNKLIYKLVKLNYDAASCGLRFLTKSDNQSFLENTALNKSHYVIYEKNI